MLRVSLTTPGRFHLFALARELVRADMLDTIFTGFPWFKVQRELVPRAHVKCAPMAQLMRFALMRAGMEGSRPERELAYHALTGIDAFALKHLRRQLPDVYFALSGCGFRSGRYAREQGAVYVCDRGSTHILHQQEIMTEEYQLHGLPVPWIDPRVIARELAEYEMADAITVPSEFVRQTFLNHGVPAEKVFKVPYGANTQSFTYVKQEALHRGFTVLFVGQLSLRKGLPDLFKAFEKLDVPGKQLVLVGGGSDEAYLKKIAPAGNVSFMGLIPHQKLKYIMSRSDVMVLPSIEEGLALVMGETLACGCPVIATENSGARDLFEDGREGFILPAREPDMFAEKMQLLADDKNLRAEMSAAALDRVHKIGGWEAYGNSMVKLFERLVTTRNPVRP